MELSDLSFAAVMQTAITMYSQEYLRHDISFVKNSFYVDADSLVGVTKGDAAAGFDIPYLAPLGAAKRRANMDADYESVKPAMTTQRLKLEEEIYQEVEWNPVGVTNAEASLRYTAQIIDACLDSVSQDIVTGLVSLSNKVPAAYGSVGTPLTAADLRFIDEEFDKNLISSPSKYMLVNSATKTELLGSQYNKFDTGSDAFRKGIIGELSGFNIIPSTFMNQMTHVSGNLNVACQLSAAALKGAKTISIAAAVDDLVGTETLKAGDLVQIDLPAHKINGSPVNYCLDADAVVVGTTMELKLTTPLVADAAIAAAVPRVFAASQTSRYNLAYVPMSFAMIARPLITPDQIFPGGSAGANFGIITDPITGFTYHIVKYTTPKNGKTYLRVGTQVGFACIQPLGAVRNII